MALTKAAKPISVRSFLPSKVGGSIRENPVTAMTTAVNRLGATVEDIGKILVSSMQVSMPSAADDRAAQLKRDKREEARLEAKNIKKKDLEKGAEKEPPDEGKLSWLEKLLQPFIRFITAAATWFVLDWLSDPANKETIKTGFNVLKTWLGTVWKVLSTGVGFVLSAFGEESPLMGALKLVAGLGLLWLADRILKPWKLIGDAARLTRFLRKNMKKGADPKKLKKMSHKQLVRRRARNIARIRRMKKLRSFGMKGLRGTGKFLKGGGLSVLAGGAAFASRLAKGESMQKAVGAGAGATIGGLAMSALLTPILGPFGPIVGQLLGSFLGEKIGAFLGDAITPLLEPIKNYFVKIAFPVFKSFLKPVIDPMIELFQDGIVPVFNMIVDFLKPIVDSVFKNIVKFINGPLVQGYIQKVFDFMRNAAWFIEQGKKVVQGVADQGGRFMNVLGLEDDVVTAERELREAQNRKSRTEGHLKNAREKLAFLKAHQAEHGPDSRIRIGQHNDAGLNTVSKRIEQEQNNIRNMEQALSGEIATLIEDRTANLETTRQQALQRLEEEERQRTAEAGAVGAKGSQFFPMPKGHFAGEVYQYHNSHPNASRSAHLGVDLVEKYPFGSDPKIDVVAVVGGKVLAEKYLKSNNYLAGMMIGGDDGYDQRYLHMMPFVNIGARVEAGQKIGELIDMSTIPGRSINDTHLHFEVYRKGQGGDLSPHQIYPKLFGTPRSHQNTIVPDSPEQGGVRMTRVPVSSINNSKLPTAPGPRTKKRGGGAAVIIQPQIRRMQVVGGGSSGPDVQFADRGATIR